MRRLLVATGLAAALLTTQVGCDDFEISFAGAPGFGYYDPYYNQPYYYEEVIVVEDYYYDDFWFDSFWWF